MRYSIYFLQHLPHFGGVVEVEVHSSNSNWRRRGRGGGEVGRDLTKICVESERYDLFSTGVLNYFLIKLLSFTLCSFAS